MRPIQTTCDFNDGCFWISRDLKETKLYQLTISLDVWFLQHGLRRGLDESY